MNVNVKCCARCGKDHDQLEFKKFEQPVFDESEWDYWALCPTTGEPILMRVAERRYAGQVRDVEEAWIENV